jgi:IMP dehydrogenase/GMP reductase
MTTNAEFFTYFEGLTFDDVVVVPGYSEVLPDAVNTDTVFARDIQLSVPLVSAAMDKVTESRLAIALARVGGLGIIHRNLTIDDQASEVRRVKRSQSGMITDPVTLPPTATLQDAENLMNRYHFSGVPITDPSGHLVGILTNRDIRFCKQSDYAKPVTEFMTSTNLITAEVGTSLDTARDILQQHRIEKLPLVDADGKLRGLITVKDIMKRQDFPNATRDSGGRLRVGAAVGVGDDLEVRVQALVDADVDTVVVDTAHGHSAGVVQAIRRIKATGPILPLSLATLLPKKAWMHCMLRVSTQSRWASVPVPFARHAWLRALACHSFQQFGLPHNARNNLACPSLQTAGSLTRAILLRHSLQAQQLSCSAACWPEPTRRQAKWSCSKVVVTRATAAWVHLVQCKASEQIVMDRHKAALSSATNLSPKASKGALRMRGRWPMSSINLLVACARAWVTQAQPIFPNCTPVHALCA